MDTLAEYLLPNGMTVFQYNDNETRFLYEEIFGKREYAPPELRLAGDPVVVDVGANIGMFSLFALAEWHPSRLLAIEPIPELQSALRLNLQGFPDAQVVPVAVGRRREIATFTYYPGFSIMSGRYCDRARDMETVKSYARWEARSLSAEERAFLELSLDELLESRFTPQSRQVQVSPLSEIIHEHGLTAVDLLKIDAEGSELDVLNGIDDEDWAKISSIVMEVDEKHVTLTETLDIIRAHRMTCATRQLEDYHETGLHLVYAHRETRPGIESAWSWAGRA
jgi:FkbM family methyltransferase